jgi:hypothetical protein
LLGTEYDWALVTAGTRARLMLIPLDGHKRTREEHEALLSASSWTGSSSRPSSYYPWSRLEPAGYNHKPRTDPAPRARGRQSQ